MIWEPGNLRYVGTGPEKLILIGGQASSENLLTDLFSKNGEENFSDFF